MKGFSLLCVASILAVVAGCTAYRDGGFERERLRDAVKRGQTVRLADFTPFEWDRVYYFAGYYTPEQMQKSMGTAVWFPDIAFFGQASEGDWTLVFLRGKKVQARVSDMSLQIDFEMRVTEWLSPDEAVFAPGEPNKGGWTSLKKLANERTGPASVRRPDAAHH